MPRTSAYDADADPNRSGQPLDGWNRILVNDRLANATWDSTYEDAGSVPSEIEAARNRLLIPSRDKRG